jgi:hypothetical protein
MRDWVLTLASASRGNEVAGVFVLSSCTLPFFGGYFSFRQAHWLSFASKARLSQRCNEEGERDAIRSTMALGFCAVKSSVMSVEPLADVEDEEGKSFVSPCQKV